MKKREYKSLALRPETVRILGDAKLVDVAGGAGRTTSGVGVHGNTCGCPPCDE